jgi:hypothetical protein
MQRSDTVRQPAIGARVWRDLGQLAAEAAVIGLLFSLLLVVGVLMMSRDAHVDAGGTMSSAGKPVSPTI